MMLEKPDQRRDSCGSDCHNSANSHEATGERAAYAQCRDIGADSAKPGGAGEQDQAELDLVALAQTYLDQRRAQISEGRALLQSEWKLARHAALRVAGLAVGSAMVVITAWLFLQALLVFGALQVNAPVIVALTIPIMINLALFFWMSSLIRPYFKDMSFQYSRAALMPNRQQEET